MKKNIAIITLSPEGVSIAVLLAQRLEIAEIYVHDIVATDIICKRFSRILDLVKDIFSSHDGLVFIGPCGVAVRAIAPNIAHKTKDPAVVVVDVCARWAISLLSGHEGGANDLAIGISNILASEPIITTTTEARKNIIVGVGCRRGVSAEQIKLAITSAVHGLGLSLGDVRLLATVDAKMSEKGLIQAAENLGIPLIFISSEDIVNSTRDFYRSDFVQQNIGAPGVSEPCALLAGRRTKLILKRKIYDGITIAIAKENCL